MTLQSQGIFGPLTMNVWKCGPHTGKRVPAMRARPIATPACKHTRSKLMLMSLNVHAAGMQILFCMLKHIMRMRSTGGPS